jgi:hypothetical protein
LLHRCEACGVVVDPILSGEFGGGGGGFGGLGEFRKLPGQVGDMGGVVLSLAGRLLLDPTGFCLGPTGLFLGPTIQFIFMKLGAECVLLLLSPLTEFCLVLKPLSACLVCTLYLVRIVVANTHTLMQVGIHLHLPQSTAALCLESCLKLLHGFTVLGVAASAIQGSPRFPTGSRSASHVLRNKPLCLENFPITLSLLSEETGIILEVTGPCFSGKKVAFLGIP